MCNVYLQHCGVDTIFYTRYWQQLHRQAKTRKQTKIKLKKWSQTKLFTTIYQLFKPIYFNFEIHKITSLQTKPEKRRWKDWWDSNNHNKIQFQIFGQNTNHLDSLDSIECMHIISWYSRYSMKWIHSNVENIIILEWERAQINW